MLYAGRSFTEPAGLLPSILLKLSLAYEKLIAANELEVSYLHSDLTKIRQLKIRLCITHDQHLYRGGPIV